MQFCFSSRRRHTRFDCDWSSDVCSSDLVTVERRRARRLERFALAPVRVALDGAVDDPERELARALDFAWADDAPGALSVARPRAPMVLLDRREVLALLAARKPTACMTSVVDKPPDDG